MYFKDLEIVTAYDLGISLEILENNVSVQGNSIKKATEWASKSGMTTIADDVGFFIPALGDKPGVLVKKWGGELENELTNQEFMKFLEGKLKDVDDTSCYFDTCYTIANPDGKIYSFHLKTFGKINKDLFNEAYVQGYPLGAVFVAEGRDKTWVEMDEREKIVWGKEMIENVVKVLPLFG